VHRPKIAEMLLHSSAEGTVIVSHGFGSRRLPMPVTLQNSGNDSIAVGISFWSRAEEFFWVDTSLSKCGSPGAEPAKADDLRPVFCLQIEPRLAPPRFRHRGEPTNRFNDVLRLALAQSVRIQANRFRINAHCPKRVVVLAKEPMGSVEQWPVVFAHGFEVERQSALLA
jgi:hypothetical protein